MRRVLLIDTETQGTDPATAACIEVGCIVYDVEHAAPVASFASLIRAESNAAENINRIPVGVLQSAPLASEVWPAVLAMASTCGAILAHNAAFDRGFVPAELRDSLPWICTKDDLAWPSASRPGLSLVALALDHGLGVSAAHRALTDCDLIARLLNHVGDDGDLTAFLAYGLRPKATYQALVSFDDRELAKAAGFGWDGPNKRWTRTMAIEDAAKLPFKTRTL